MSICTGSQHSFTEICLVLRISLYRLSLFFSDDESELSSQSPSYSPKQTDSYARTTSDEVMPGQRVPSIRFICASSSSSCLGTAHGRIVYRTLFSALSYCREGIFIKYTGRDRKIKIP